MMQPDLVQILQKKSTKNNWEELPINFIDKFLPKDLYVYQYVRDVDYIRNTV